MQDRTIDNALLALWKRGGDQADMVKPLMEARGVKFPRHYHTAPLSRGGCSRFVIQALQQGPMAATAIADLLQASKPDTPRRSALNRVYCCLVRLEEKDMVCRGGNVWALAQ